jgi:hypothetical protein
MIGAIPRPAPAGSKTGVVAALRALERLCGPYPWLARIVDSTPRSLPGSHQAGAPRLRPKPRSAMLPATLQRC